MNEGGTPENLKPFKKGQSGNPKGRPPKLLSSINTELREKGYERVSPSQVIEAYELLFGLDEDRIKGYISDKETPMFLRIVAKQMLTTKGHEMIERMLDRAHGKAKQEIKQEVTSNQLEVVVKRMDK